MKSSTLDVLLIEDNLAEAGIIKDQLSKVRGEQYAVEHCQYLAQGLDLLRDRSFDAIILDLGLPDSQGLDTITALRKQEKNAPVIVTTSLDDEELALKSMDMDIQDYLIKDEITGNILKRAIRYAIQRKRSNEELRRSELKFATIFQAAPVLLDISKPVDGEIIEVNETLLMTCGYQREEMVGRTARELCIWENPAERDKVVRALFKQGPVRDLEINFRDKSGQPVNGLLSAELLEIEGERYMLSLVKDITERKQIEEALLESEERFRATFNQAAVGIGHVAPDGRLLRINKKYCDIVGYSEEEFKSLTIRDITHPDDLEKSMQKYQLLLEGKLGDYSLEKRYIRKDGSTIWVNLTASVVFDGNGNPRFAVGVIEDISARKNIEASLRESEQRFASFMLHLPTAAWMKDLRGRYVYANNEAERVFSMPLAALQGKTDEEVFPPETARRFRENDERILADGCGLQTIEVLRQADGIEHHSIVNKFAVPGPDGQPAYVAGVALDITERKRVQDEIARLNTELSKQVGELEAANQELNTYNYTVAHDLRNPLNVISSYCQVLKEMCGDKLDKQCRGYVQGTYESVMRMNRLIGALLEFSRLANGQLKLDRVDLSSIAKEVAEELKKSEPARLVDIRIADGIVAEGDPDLLHVVLANLIGNAWKYTAVREEAVIEFAATEMDGKPTFWVRDNGPGFDMADADKLFTSFKRLPSAEECSGFGIGLATVERIIRRHGGKIWAEGEPGKGAYFYFTLPL